MKDVELKTDGVVETAKTEEKPKKKEKKEKKEKLSALAAFMVDRNEKRKAAKLPPAYTDKDIEAAK